MWLLASKELNIKKIHTHTQVLSGKNAMVTKIFCLRRPNYFFP